jgi:hypothetical protein
VKKYRVIVDICRGVIVPVHADTVEVEGTLYVRWADGSLRPFTAEQFHSGPEMVGTAWHDDLTVAYTRVAEELDRRIEELTALRSMTLRSMAPAGAEVIHA